MYWLAREAAAAVFGATRTTFADARASVAAFLVAGGAEDLLGEAVGRGNVGSA